MSLPHSLRGIVSMVLAMGALIASDACMKVALADAPLFQLMFIRGCAAVAMCLAMLAAMGQLRDLSRLFHPFLIARGLCEMMANIAFITGIMYMAIADVTAITQTCPLFVLIGARLIWGERLGPVRVFLILLGITGALLVAQPGTSAFSGYAMLGFVTAIAAAARDLMTRKVPPEVPGLVAALGVMIILMLAGGIGTVMFETPVMPSSRHIFLMLLAAALIVAGQFFVFMAYRIGPARSVAPFMYTLTIWAVLFGVFLFGDIPNMLAIAGMGLVALAGLLIIYIDERQRRFGGVPALASAD